MKIRADIELTKGTFIPSVNNLARAVRTKFGVRVYKTKNVREFQDKFHKLLLETPLVQILEYDVLSANVNFIFNIYSRFDVRDTSNMIKISEDVLKDVIGVDDNRFIKICGEKRKLADKSLPETIDIEVELLDFSLKEI